MCSLTLNPARNQSLAPVGDSDSELEGPHFRVPLMQTLRKVVLKHSGISHPHLERDVQPRSSLQVQRESFLELLQCLLHPCKRSIVRGGV